MNFKLSSDFSIAVILTVVYIILNCIFYQQLDILSSTGVKDITPKGLSSLSDNSSDAAKSLSADDKNKMKPEENSGDLSNLTLNKEPKDNQENLPVFKPDNKLEIDDSQVFSVVEVYPLFPGGERARMKFLQQNIRYPSDAIAAKIEGKVIVNFIVEKDGTVSNLKIINSIDKECDEEALRVARLMPKWIPGKQSGIPVRVNFNMPITFRLKM